MLVVTSFKVTEYVLFVKRHKRHLRSPLLTRWDLCYNIRSMLVKLKTFSLLGIDAVLVEVEVDWADIGMPKTILIGLPEAAVKESTYRIERAIENSGYFNPIHRTVINLAPADFQQSHNL